MSPDIPKRYIMKNKLKHPYHYIKTTIEKENYKLLSKEYYNQRQKLEIQCPKGHKFLMDFNHFNSRGQRCPYCSGKMKLTYSFIKGEIEKENYKLLSKEYINAHTKLQIKCDKGHIYNVKWHNFKSGNRCPHCAGKAKHTYSYIKEQIESVEGYKLLSKEYINKNTNMNIQCNKGHIYKANWGHFRGGTRCPYCAGLTSKPEKELVKLIKENIGIDFIENDKSQIYNKNTKRYMELDLYFPSLNKAIEFNGVYWHSIEEVKQRDIIKQKICKEKGIDLFVIKEEKWNNKDEYIKDIKYWLT